MIDERPSPMCDHVPRSACALAYDSAKCSGGWKLVIPEGNIRFRWFSSTWKYRNDMDTVGVRPGCKLLLFTDSDFTGHKVSIYTLSNIIYTVSIHYQHTIYTLSIHYLHTIYSLSTLYLTTIF